MLQSPLLLFESSVFPITPDEDRETNPGIYGKALAGWLARELHGAGFAAGSVFAEDYGWCVPIASSARAMHVVCANGERPHDWQVFVFAEGGTLASVMARVRGARDTRAAALNEVFAAVKQTLASSPDVRNLREESP
jgi:hypothetical protein